MKRNLLTAAAALFLLLAGTGLMAENPEALVPTSGDQEVQALEACPAPEAEAVVVEDGAAIEAFGTDFGESLTPKPVAAWCPYNQPCLGGFFCEEFRDCPEPSCIGGICRYE
ncbi:MAG: hypothetical protein KDD47_09315 [Acidobacteria bacterium]|nr:hypothetical protein [Acidobacteriota bacterium]